MKLGPRKLIGSVIFAALTVALMTFEMLDLPELTRITIGTTAGFVGMLAFQVLIDMRRLRAELQRIPIRVRRTITGDRSKQAGSIGHNQSAKNLSKMVEGVHATGEAQLKEIQHLRSDIEWLEQILQGVANRLANYSVSHTAWAENADASSPSVADASGTPQESIAVPESPTQETGLRVLRAYPDPQTFNTSARRINHILEACGGARSYLEVGLDYGKTFENIRADCRVGIDPIPRFDTTHLPPNCQVFIGTSDDFFRIAKTDFRFDVIFIDGLHIFHQVYRDLLNALSRLRDGGTILVDDVVPSDAVSAIPNLDQSLAERRRQGLTGAPWHGDVYKLVPAIRDLHPELNYRTIRGSGNEQLLIWQGRNAVTSAPPKSKLEEYNRLSFVDVFASGVPDYFQPLPESEVLLEVIERIKAK